LVARGTLRGVIPTTFDEYVIICGGTEGAAYVSAAASGRFIAGCPPIIFGAQQNLLLNLWFTSTNAASTWEVEAAWWER